MRTELVLHESRCGSEEEVEVAEGSRTQRSSHYRANSLLCKQGSPSW